jgi:hypothetical protein
MQMALIVLGLAALGGVALAGIRLGGTPRPPTWLALVHGLIAATGLVLLGDAWMKYGIPLLAQVSFGIFVLAALGGAVMFFGYHLGNRALPVLFVLGHGLIAVAAYALLLIVYFRGT